jgi:hypothetical protein
MSKVVYSIEQALDLVKEPDKDEFIEELHRLSEDCEYRMHWQTLMKLQKITRRYRCHTRSKKYRFLLGKLGEEYILKEFIYPALHSLNYKRDEDYYLKIRYPARRKNGDIDIFLNIRGKRYYIEVKNWACHYTILPEAYKDQIFDTFDTCDKYHNGIRILFINRCRVGEVSLPCRRRGVHIIPIGIQIGKGSLNSIEGSFRAIDNDIDYWKNLQLVVYNEEKFSSLEWKHF